MQQAIILEVQDSSRLRGIGDPLRIVQESEIWPYYQMVNEQTKICLSKRDA